MPEHLSNPAPTLVFGWGNPSRGDDALGPLLIDRLEALNLPDVDCLTDFQLQVEHSLDLLGRQRVLFVDASVDCPAPYQLAPLQARSDASLNSHAMSPAALLQVCKDVHGTAPEAWLLAIRGERFELGEGLSTAATNTLDSAFTAISKWISGGTAVVISAEEHGRLTHRRGKLSNALLRPDLAAEDLDIYCNRDTGRKTEL